MKGGKWLSEDARGRLVKSIRKAIYDIETISPSIAIDLDIVARFLERDDEPECCTCGQPYGTITIIKKGVETKRCFLCSKPVKGE